MDITKLELKDITDELILQHYNLDTERKSKHKNTTQEIDIVHDIGEGETIFDFLDNVQKAYDKVITNLEIPNNYKIADARLVPEQDYDGTTIEVRVKFSRLETDEEVLQRLFNGILRNIRRYKKALKSKESAEDKERKIYEELKNKYEN